MSTKKKKQQPTHRAKNPGGRPPFAPGKARSAITYTRLRPAEREALEHYAGLRRWGSKSKILQTAFVEWLQRRRAEEADHQVEAEEAQDEVA